MPDDLSGLVAELRKQLARENGVEPDDVRITARELVDEHGQTWAILGEAGIDRRPVGPIEPPKPLPTVTLYERRWWVRLWRWIRLRPWWKWIR